MPYFTPVIRARRHLRSVSILDGIMMNTRYSASQLKPDGERTVQAPVVGRETQLAGLAGIFARHETRHILVEDEAGSIIGIVSEDDLRNALRDTADANPTAWHQRTVESLLTVTLDEGEPAGSMVREFPAELRWTPFFGPFGGVS